MPNDTRTPDEVRVTQADREAAADLLASIAGDAIPAWEAVRAIRVGEVDDHRFPRAFARHRIAAERAAQGGGGVDPDLICRCQEVLDWRRTGVLTGDALKAYAARHGFDDRAEPSPPRRAELDTITGALEQVAALSPPSRQEPGAEVERLRSALEPFARKMESVMADPATGALDPLLSDDDYASVSIADLRRARAALADGGGA